MELKIGISKQSENIYLSTIRSSTDEAFLPFQKPRIHENVAHISFQLSHKDSIANSSLQSDGGRAEMSNI